MQSFKDEAGRVWLITLSVSAIKRVKAMCDVNLSTLADADSGDPLKPVADFVGDMLRFPDALYALCKPEIDAHKLTQDEFCDLLGGDVLNAAQLAFVRGLIDFFHEAKARTGLHKIIDQGLKIQATNLQKAVDSIGKPEPKKK